MGTVGGYEKVVSTDGTPIAFRRAGKGPPLVLVHGTTGSDFSWRFVEPLLSAHFTLHAMQRRGRGESGDGPGYSMVREAEDVAAVVDSIGGSVDLFGHSYGADCALEASLLTKNLRKLVLYEPAVEFPYPHASIEEQERLAGQGKNEELIELVFSAEGVLSADEMAALKASPTWPARVALAPTIPRESREDARYTVSAQRFTDMRVPTLLLLGTESGKGFQTSIEKVHEALPDSRVVILEGHGHAAIMTAPELVASEVIRFLTG